MKQIIWPKNRSGGCKQDTVSVDFTVAADQGVNLKEKVKMDKYLNLAKWAEEMREHEGDNHTHYYQETGNSPKDLLKYTR